MIWRRIPVGRRLLALVVDAPSNPGNLGTIVRSCDALGADGVIVTGHAVDVYDPATITASRGSIFALPVVRLDSPAAVARWVADARQTIGDCVIVGADEKGSADLAAHDFGHPAPWFCWATKRAVWDRRITGCATRWFGSR